jgi:hypothetical protein
MGRVRWQPAAARGLSALPAHRLAASGHPVAARRRRSRSSRREEAQTICHGECQSLLTSAATFAGGSAGCRADAYRRTLPAARHSRRRLRPARLRLRCIKAGSRHISKSLRRVAKRFRRIRAGFRRSPNDLRRIAARLRRIPGRLRRGRRLLGLVITHIFFRLALNFLICAE